MYLQKWIVMFALCSSATAFALTQNEIRELINHPTKLAAHNDRHVNNQAVLNWSSLHGPRIGGEVRVVAAKNNSAQLFAFRYANPVLYKSMDGGQSWKAIYIFKNEWIRDLVEVDENHWLMTADNHVYASDDQGEHWKLTSTKDTVCNNLYVANPNLIFMVTNRMYDLPGFYRSIDGGHSWEPAVLGLDSGNWFWGVGGKDHLQFVGADGLYVSTNGGKLWTQPSKDWSNKNIQSIVISSQFDVFVSGMSGIYRTDPQGQSWNNIRNGIKEDIRQITIDKNDKLFIAANHLYASVDKGQSWQQLDDYTGVHSMTILENGHAILGTSEALIEVDEQQKFVRKLPFNFSVSETTKVFATDDQHFFAMEEDLYRSDDAGITWALSRKGKMIDAAVFSQNIVELEWDKNGNDQHILSSDDNGLTWKNVYDNIYSVNQSPCNNFSAHNGALIVSCKQHALITHDLITWNIIDNAHDGYTTPYYFDGKFIYYSNGNVIKRSEDEGKSWTILFDKLHGYTPHVAGYQDTVLISIYGAGIIKITNHGKDWDLINNGITDFHFSDVIAIDATHFVASTHDGVFYTNDGGMHWTEESKGLDNLDVTSIFASNKFILAGTKGNGVYLSLMK